MIRSCDLLQATLENVHQGISVFDRDLRLIRCNRRFLELLDLPPAFGRVGVTLRQIIRFNAERGEFGPGDSDSLVARRLELFVGTHVFERRRPNGIVLEIRTSPMPAGYVITYSDITEYVRATAELAAANEVLSRAKTAAEDANLGKTRFLAATSHDLLQPLSAARLYVSALLEQQSSVDFELVRKVDASLHLVEDLLGTLLDISRLDAGALIPDRDDFALGQLFESLRTAFVPLAQKKGIDLRIVLTSLTVASDRHLLYRVLQNLLSNALRYTHTGKVLMGVRRSGAGVIIQVSDTGIGIPFEYQNRVFQEFQYFPPAGTDHGLGLGLSIVDRISRILDHPVRFWSLPGHGTTFIVRVPRSKGSEACSRIEVIPQRALASFEQAVVLCVGDDMAVLDGVRTLLEGWSCQVLLARGISEAVALAYTEPLKPELLIVDYDLNQSSDGEDCIDALRRAFGATHPAVIITADRSEAVRSRALARGLMVLHKPVKPAALRSLLMRLLATRQAAE